MPFVAVFQAFIRALRIATLVAIAAPSAVAETDTIGRGGDPRVAHWSRRSWQTRDGLPDGAVTSIAQESDGTLRVGTTGGAVRFDGVRMRPLVGDGTVLPQGTLPTAEATVVSRCTDGDGSVWLGYSNGHVQRLEAGAVRTYGPAAGLTPSKPAHVVADNRGAVWVAQSGRLAEFCATAQRFKPVAALPAGMVKVAVAPARDGGLWIKVDEPLFHHSTTAGLVMHTERTTGGVATMFEDMAGRLWLGTDRNGVFVLTGTAVRQVPTVGSRVHAITEDREGGIWVGTSTALNRLWPSVAWRSGSGGDKPLRRLCTDASGDVWGITVQGELAKLPIAAPAGDGRSRPITFFDKAAGWDGVAADSLCVDNAGTIWIGRRDGTIQTFADGRFEAVPAPHAGVSSADDPSIHDIVVSRAGDVWVGIRSTVWRRAAGGEVWEKVRFAAPSGGPAGAWGAIQRLVEDASGFIWAITARGELVRIAADGSGAVRTTPPQLGGGAAVTAVKALADGGVWIAARDVGLFRFHDGAVGHVGKAEGLPSTGVLAMTVDPAGRLWCFCSGLAFAASLDELDRVATGRQRLFHPWVLSADEESGFLDAVGDPQCDATMAGDGTVCFTLAKGLGIASPARLPPSSAAPAVEVEEVRVDGHVVASAMAADRAAGWTEPVVIPPDPRTLEIRYAPRTFTVPSNMAIETRLDGIDTDWVPGDLRHVVTYAGLRAGRYALRLRSSNERDEWTALQPAVVIEIQPFLWERNWFRAAMVAAAAAVAAAAGLAFASYRGRLKMEALRRQAALEAERVRIARDMHDELGTSLTQIALLADLARGESAADDSPHLGNVARISRELVRSMDELVWTVTPSNDTLPHLISYIGQSASETLGQFDIACRIVASPDVADLPAGADLRRNVLLVVKEAVSNVVEHAGATTVEITIRVSAGRLALTIADDGGGIARVAPVGAGVRTGHGLENMRRRVEELGGSCHIDDVRPHGTAIAITLPLTPDEKESR